MRVIADQERCLGAGQCVLHAPDVFDQSDEDGTVVLLTEKPSEDRIEAVRTAVEMCPNSVLSLAKDEPVGSSSAEGARSS